MNKRGVWILLAGAACLRFLFLGAKSLWFDEASTLLIAGRPLSEMTELLVLNEVNPPLHYALMGGWLKLFPDPRLGLRVFSALCGVAALFAFKGLAERVLPASARRPALFLAALSSFWIHAAQDGRCYSLLLLISILSTRLVFELRDKPGARRWAAYAALAVAGLWTHYYYAVLLAGHAVWLFPGRDRRGFLLAHATAAAAFTPWLPSMLAQVRVHTGELVVMEPLTPMRILDLLGSPFFDVSYLGLVFPDWTRVVVGAGFAVLLARARREEPQVFSPVAAHLGVGFAVICAVELLGGRPVTQPRYMYSLSPLILLAAAAGLSGASRAARAARLATALVVLGGTSGYFFSALNVDSRLSVLAAFIRRSSAPELPVVYLGKYYYLPLRVYYLPERRNLLLADAAIGMDYRGMPPYSGVVERSALPGLGPCVVVDESRVLGGDRVVIGTGAQLAEALRR